MANTLTPTQSFDALLFSLTKSASRKRDASARRALKSRMKGECRPR